MILGIWGGSFLEPNPWQWAFGTGIGTNIGSSIVWGSLAGLIGVFVGRKVKAAWAKHVAHNEWVAVHLAALHRKQVGPPAPHPHFDLPAAEALRVHTEIPREETSP